MTAKKYPCEQCDEACYYHCTKGGQQEPECITIDNNGWRTLLSIKEGEKEQSFNQLPKTNRYYDFVVKGKIEYRYYYSGCISSDAYVENNVTHFRLSPVHELPIY